MAALDRIRTQGFRRWYERQLIECHAWLVAWFLGVIALASGIEVAGTGSRLAGAFLLLAGLALTVYSWQRYRVLLAVAERLGAQAVCPACGTYARFKIRASGPMPLPDGGDVALEDQTGGVWLRAQCDRCGESWMMRSDRG